ARRGAATPLHIWPKWDWGTLSFGAASIAYAMSGMEAAGNMGAEIHDPRRTLPRASWIASAFATTFYALGTISLLVILTPEKINVLSGFGAATEEAGAVLGMAWLAPVMALILLVTGVGQFGGLGTSVSRLPFVA